MIAWFSRFLPKRQVRIIHAYGGMTLEDWRKDLAAISQAKELFRTPLIRGILSVMRTSIPCGYPARGNQVNDTMANIELGRIQGYMDAVNLLESLPNQEGKPDEQIPNDYGVPDDWTDFSHPAPEPIKLK